LVPVLGMVLEQELGLGQELGQEPGLHTQLLSQSPA